MSPKRTIKAKEIVNDIRAHMTDAEIMDKYELSAKGLQSMLSKLLSIKAVTQKEIDRRPAACSDTVVIRQITAGELVQEIRLGVSDFELMEKYGLSSKGLEKAYRILIEAAVITEGELRNRSQSVYDTVFIESMRELPRYYLALTVEIHDAARPGTPGKLRDITEQGVGITGIRATIGEVKTLVIPAESFIDVQRIVFDAECIWTEPGGPGGEPAAGFRIANISEQGLNDLKELIRAVAFDR
ncbi:MAG: PilZ domain-containing protein [Desulfomonile tiedjei]|nr:PilZ domain-containing protein [Desulfomonile tiedjei]